MTPHAPQLPPPQTNILRPLQLMDQGSDEGFLAKLGALK